VAALVPQTTTCALGDYYPYTPWRSCIEHRRCTAQEGYFAEVSAGTSAGSGRLMLLSSASPKWLHVLGYCYRRLLALRVNLGNLPEYQDQFEAECLPAKTGWHKCAACLPVALP
jgi:hypothetical protein